MKAVVNTHYLHGTSAKLSIANLHSCSVKKFQKCTKDWNLMSISHIFVYKTIVLYRKAKNELLNSPILLTKVLLYYSVPNKDPENFDLSQTNFWPAGFHKYIRPQIYKTSFRNQCLKTVMYAIFIAPFSVGDYESYMPLLNCLMWLILLNVSCNVCF